MKSKKLFLFLLPLVVVAMALFMSFTANVHAEGENAEATKKIRFKTTILDWKYNNDLEFSCGTAVATNGTINPKVYYKENDGDYSEVSCNFDLEDLGVETDSSITIIEEFDFTSYVGTNTEFEEVTITPGKVSSDTVGYDDDDYMFGEYHPTDEETGIVYNMNTVDDNGNIIGGLYVYRAYIDDADDTKNAEKDFGTISIPTYCINLHFNVRGNIANPYGTFHLNLLGDEITAFGGDTETLCEIGGEDISFADIDAILDIDPEGDDISYTGVTRADDYIMEIVDDGSYVEGLGVIYQDIRISAVLDSDGSQTGLLYTLIPFIVLLISAGVGYVVIRRNSIQRTQS